MSGGARPVRVLMVGPSLDILGGQAVQAARLRESLAADPTIQLRFLAVNPRLPGPFRFLQRIRFVRTLVTEAAYLASLLRRLPGCDVVHVYSASYFSFLLAPAPALLLGRLFRRRIILNYHSGEAADHLARYGWHAIPLMRMANRIVVQSAYLQEVFSRHGLAAEVIPNALDESAFVYRRRSRLEPRFFTNRNHEPHYGVDTVLQAFSRIQADRPDASLVVAGRGSQSARLQAQAGVLRLERVTFTGSVPPERMPALYQEADIFLNGSRIDNMPLSILEAFVSGLPVVSTAAGGIAHLVEHGRTGLLVPVDEPEALAAAALSLLRNPDLGLRMADAAREECLGKYAEATVAAAWGELYHALGHTLASRRHPAAANAPTA